MVIPEPGPRPRKRLFVGPVFLALGLLLAGCASSGSPAARSPAADPALQVRADYPPGSPWPDSCFLEAQGSRLHYRDLPVPPGQASRGRVLLIHGFGASVYCWRFLGPALVEAGYEVVEVDYPPFGWSSSSEAELKAAMGQVQAPDLGTAKARAGLLWAFVDALDAQDPKPGPRPDPRSWVLVGHSLGGRVAAHMALQRPGALRGLVLIAPAVFGPAGSPSLGQSKAFSAFLEGYLPSYLASPDKLRPALAQAFGREPLPGEIEGYWAPFLRPGAEPSLRAWARVASEVAEPRVGDIKAPTLILWGEADRIVRNQGRRLEAAIPGSRYLAFPGAGHVLMETEAPTTEAAVLGFLGSL